MGSRSVRVVTYNIHKCQGLDRKIRPDRIARVLGKFDADIIALQEVVSVSNGKPEDDQVRYIASSLGDLFWCFGENRKHAGGAYGNATLSRYPVRMARNYDITWHKRERRGCLRADIVTAEGHLLHVFNVHLGTGFVERRHQGRRLVGGEVLTADELRGPRIVVGDFNEWTRGLASRLMSQNFQSVDLKAFASIRRTYPGVLPLVHLDHFYFSAELRLRNYKVDRSVAALAASDHLPIVAEFECAPWE
jgi:endonuclease/exonuclease/phosphatase family metal-dependent hydrolase